MSCSYFLLFGQSFSIPFGKIWQKRDCKGACDFTETRFLTVAFLPFEIGRVGFEPTINGLKVRCLKPDLATDLGRLRN